VKLQPGAGDRLQIRGEAFLHRHIRCDEMHLAVMRRLNEGIGVTVDRDVQHGAAMIVAIGAEVGAAPGKPQSQRNPGADDR
jgi:hypothetical protein